MFITHDRGRRRRTAEALVATGHQVFSFELGEDALRVMMFADLIIAEATQRPMDDVDFFLRVRTVSASPVVVFSSSSAEFVRTYGDMIGSMLTASEDVDLTETVMTVAASMTPAAPPAEEPATEPDAGADPLSKAEPAPATRGWRKRQFFAGLAALRKTRAADELLPSSAKFESGV